VGDELRKRSMGDYFESEERSLKIDSKEQAAEEDEEHRRVAFANRVMFHQQASHHTVRVTLPHVDRL